MGQRDANLLGAPRLQLGADPLRLATDDQCRRSRPIGCIVGTASPGTSNHAARQSSPQLLEGSRVKRDERDTKMRAHPGADHLRVPGIDRLRGEIDRRNAGGSRDCQDRAAGRAPAPAAPGRQDREPAAGTGKPPESPGALARHSADRRAGARRPAWEPAPKAQGLATILVLPAARARDEGRRRTAGHRGRLGVLRRQTLPRRRGGRAGRGSVPGRWRGWRRR
ncbi:MAG: hypothetical protein K0R44_2220 [Thermomicrobiales bacterium]|nr:hypothetical protein [Thermomicrobiales bacterium]